jgi:hypothetical protein
METALVVATENGTTINVNGAATGLVLNEGEYTMIDGTDYINQGNGHYNMSIAANKIYMFINFWRVLVRVQFMLQAVLITFHL